LPVHAGPGLATPNLAVSCPARPIGVTTEVSSQ
jgi:hypothetical protein